MNCSNDKCQERERENERLREREREREKQDEERRQEREEERRLILEVRELALRDYKESSRGLHK